MEGNLCNSRPIDTEERLKELMADKGGAEYYKQMESLDVDPAKVMDIINSSMTSKIKTWLNNCAHCGMCARACHFWLTSDKDATQIPSYKIQSTLGELIRRKDKVDAKFMMDAMDTAWGKCTCCNRCGVYCPLGIDTGVMMSYFRGVLFKLGFIPWEMKIGSGMHRVYHAQMDVTEEDFVDTCDWMAEESAEEWPGLTIPVDKENADIMYILNAREVKHYPNDIAETAILFHIAGENWTVPSSGWENTSLTMFAGDWEGCKMNTQRIYDAIKRLNPKSVVGTECGHAHRATVVEGPYWCGQESGDPPVPFYHYVEWVAHALREGKLKIDPAKKLKGPVTLQDSCNYVRNHGLGKYTREIMSYICEDFRDMTPSGDHNFCCGGGGGLNGIGRYRQWRNVSLKNKLDQIQNTGADLVVAPCHNCWDAIRDMFEVYEIKTIKWSFLKPLLISMVEIPDNIEHVTE